MPIPQSWLAIMPMVELFDAGECHPGNNFSRAGGLAEAHRCRLFPEGGWVHLRGGWRLVSVCVDLCWGAANRTSNRDRRPRLGTVLQLLQHILYEYDVRSVTSTLTFWQPKLARPTPVTS